MSQLMVKLSDFWNTIQASLFPFLETELDPLTEKQQQLVAILELIRIEKFIPDYKGYEGRPQKSRIAIARAFVAKIVYNLDTNTLLIERLKTDRNLRKICGWEFVWDLPSESTFSRAFAEFAKSSLPQSVHDTLIKNTFKNTVVIHNSRDSTSIEAREKPESKPKTEIQNYDETQQQNPEDSVQKIAKKLKKKGRHKKGEQRLPEEPKRIEKQKTMTLEQMLDDLPTACNKGAKKDSKGNVMYWTGYKLHLDTGDHGIPISAIVTSASVHDSQVAIPLGVSSAQKVTTCYDLMDAAYDVPAIIEHSQSLGHVPLIDKNPRRNQELRVQLEAEAKARKTLNWKFPEDIRYNVRTTAERANSRLKDEFGVNKVRVRGHLKVSCHLLFSVLILAADQILKLAL